MRKANKNIVPAIDSISIYGGVENTRYFYHGDHLGSSSWITDKDGNALQYISYLPYGQLFMDLKTTSYDASYKFIGKERDTETGFDYFGARYYSNALGVWLSVDPLAEKYPSLSPYNYTSNNPITRIDPVGLSDVAIEDWVENTKGRIYWNENATSPATTQSGEKYLGKNVLVATHNRGANLNESINTAWFALYLESNHDGPTATIWGNTVPADVNLYGTMAEGIYPSVHTKYLGHDALLINGGDNIPTVNGNNNPNAWQNYNSNGTMKPKDEQTLNGVLFHIGNNYSKSMSYYNVNFSIGCQTGGCGPGSAKNYDNFAKFLVGFKGNYYLRNSYHLEKPYKCNMK